LECESENSISAHPHRTAPRRVALHFTLRKGKKKKKDKETKGKAKGKEGVL